MDEHLILQEGRAVQLTRDFVHEDRKGLSAWLQKHEGYASRQADLLLTMARHVPSGSLIPRLLGEQAQRKRWFKANLYAGLPLFVRAGLYFLYAYVFRLGFLDGTQGLIFHFLHAGWYMFYVDAKIYEQRKLKG